MAETNIFVGVSIYRGGTNPGVFRQTLGEKSWEQLRNGLPDPVRCTAVTVHPQDANLVFAGTHDGPYLSADQGNTWKRPNFPDKGVQIWSFLVHPTKPDTVFAGGAPTAFYRSDDRGQSWRLLQRPQTPERAKMDFPCRVMRIAHDPAKPNDFYAIIEVNGVMRSRDGGETWSDCSAGLIRLADEPRLKSKIGSDSEAEGMLDGHALCVTPADPGAVFLAVRMGLFRSGDGGDSWTDLEVGKQSPLTYARDIRPAPQDPKTLYACLSVHSTGDTGSLVKSTDVGKTWTRFDHGPHPTSTMMNLALHPRDPKQVYGVTRKGQVIGTRDGGASFFETRLPEGCGDCYAVACG